MRRALLIGNGINQLDPSQSFSWSKLLKDLQSRFDIKVDLDNPFKPFPLAFEEMLYRKDGYNDIKDKLKRLKQGIRESIDDQLNGKPGFNQYHMKIMELGYDDILTTNYDYGLEKSIVPDFVSKKIKLAQYNRERKHSLRRSYRLNEQVNVWHIHGELFDSRNLSETSSYYNEESIMIGFEHYSDHLELIQNEFNGRTQKKRNKENIGLIKRLQNGITGVYWYDLFFTHNLDIIGLGLDFSENHLWWLLNQRAEHMRRPDRMEKLLIKNQIRFFFPKFDSITISNKKGSETTTYFLNKWKTTQQAKAIAEVLDAFKVEIIPIKCNSYETFYGKFVSGNYMAETKNM